MVWKLVAGLLLIFKESSVKGNLRSDLYISNISSLRQEFLFPIEVVLNSFQTKKGPGTSFQITVFVEFLINAFLL